jgi:hypothetical protein
MIAQTHRPNREGSLILGGGLVIIGAVALAMSLSGLDPDRWLGRSGWTLFVIIPGVLLLAAGLLTNRPAAVGLTVAGSIVVTIGLLLLGMDQTDRWDAWAYAWALIPMAAGIGLVMHGIRARDRSVVTAGLRLGGIALALLIAGAWFFETLFRTGELPVDLGDGWPILVIAIGAIVVLLGLFGGPLGDEDANASS